MSKTLIRVMILFVGCLVLFVGIIALSLPGSRSVKKNSICLSMIVKNESSIIETCLASVKGLIDYWVIVDTGSTDGTQEIIKKYMKGIPGELHERPWVHFGHNRNEALQLAKDKAEYSMFIDADDVLVFSEGFTRPVFDKDLYKIIIKQKGSIDYGKCFLVRNDLGWQWKGVMHESIESPRARTMEIVQGAEIQSDTTKGARYKNPRKYLDDADVLKKGLVEEPNNTRYQFYLAQCYATAGELALSLKEYQRRVEMGLGFEHEYFFSLYMIGRLQEMLHMPTQIVLASYKKAHEYRPLRLEPLFYMSLCYVRAGEDAKAYDCLKKASLTVKDPLDDFFVEGDVAWKLQHSLAEVSWRLGKVKETLQACERLVSCDMAPERLKEEIKGDIARLRRMVAEQSQ